MENGERNLISWLSQKKAAGEVSQVGPERRKKDLLEPGTNIWFTESFVNIFKFSLNFFEVIYWRARISEAAADCTVGSCIQLYPALQVKLVLLVIAFLTWLKSFSPCCHPLFIFYFYCISWRGDTTILTLYHSNVVMGNWFQQGNFCPSFSLFPSAPGVFTQPVASSLPLQLCHQGTPVTPSQSHPHWPSSCERTKWSHLKLQESELFIWLLLCPTEKLMQLLQLLRSSDPLWCPVFFKGWALDENNF